MKRGLYFADCAKAPDKTKVNPTCGHLNNHRVALQKAQWQTKKTREKSVKERAKFLKMETSPCPLV